MGKYPIKILNKVGTLIINCDRPRPYTGECVHCKKKIYFVKTLFKKKYLISIHDEDTYISHFWINMGYPN